MTRAKIQLTKRQILAAFNSFETTGQVAASLGVSYQTLVRRCQEFEIPFFKNPSGKGLTAQQRYGNEKAKLLAEKLSSSSSRPCSAATRLKLRDLALERIDTGSMPSRGLKGRYNDIWFDSSWELAYYLWMFEVKGITIRRNTKRFFDYLDDQGIARRTKPDFILPDGTLIEIKGYPNVHTAAKIRATSHLVTFLFRSDLEECLSYCIAKYGKKFTVKFYADMGER